MAKVKISELPSLSPATLDTTYVVGISGSTTYKISINQLTSSLDTTFATDLVTAALSSSLDGKLSTSSYSTDSASFNSRIISGSVVTGTISSSAQITAFGFLSTSTDLSSLNTISASYLSFTQSYYSASASFDSRVDSLENATSSYLTSLNGAISGAGQISDLGFVTGAYTTINSFNSLTQSFNSISQSFSVISGSVGTIDFSTLATTSSNTFKGNQIVSGSVGISANTGSWNFRTDGTLVLPNNTGIYGNGLLQIDTIGGFLLTSYTDQVGGGSQEWYFHSDGILNVPGNIEGADNLLTTSSFNTFTQSYYSASASFDSRVDSLEFKDTTLVTTGSNVFYGDQVFIGNALTQSVELVAGETYGGGIVFNVVSGSYTLIVDVNDLGYAQPRYVQVATNATSSDGAVNQSLILALPNIDMDDPAVMAHSSSVGGYTDWYIPSYTEIALINSGLGYQRIYVGFSPTNKYWTSNYAEHPAYTYYSSGGDGSTDRMSASTGDMGQYQRPVVAIRKINRSYREVYGNANIIVSGSLNVTGSITGSTNFNTIVNKPTLISSSAQVLNGSDIFSSSAQLPIGLVSGSSQILNSSGIFSSSAQLPTGLISSSTQLPSNLVSGSSQISTLGFITGSYISSSTYTTDSSSFNSRIISGSAVAGTISGSAQISTLGFVSSSNLSSIRTITSASYAALTPVSGTLYIIIG